MTTDNIVMTVQVWQHRTAGERYIVKCNRAGAVLAAVGPVYYADIEEMLATENWTNEPELADDLNARADEYRALSEADLLNAAQHVTYAKTQMQP